ncbi:MAG: RluA family pseudouridine synthase, partial [Wujia sp.]
RLIEYWSSEYNMRELCVSSKEEGQRINKFLLKYLNEATSSFIYKMIRKKNIVLNDKKCTGNEILKAGDSIKLYLSEETIDKFRVSKDSVKKKTEQIPKYELNILYEDSDIMVVHKPAGMLSQKAESGDVSINEYIVDYYNKTKDKADDNLFKPSVCNRLDRNTSGIILAGKSLRGSQYLSQRLRDRTIDKYYYTIVKGCINDNITYKGYIAKDTNTNKSEVIAEEQYETLALESRKQYQRIETIIYPMDCNGTYSLLKLKLVTGKSHQLRANLKELGYPIIGDGKYGDSITNRYFRDKYKLRHHLLHAGELKLSEDLTIIDELPDLFKNICKGLGLEYANC